MMGKLGFSLTDAVVMGCDVLDRSVVCRSVLGLVFALCIMAHLSTQNEQQNLKLCRDVPPGQHPEFCCPYQLVPTSEDENSTTAQVNQTQCPARYFEVELNFTSMSDEFASCRLETRGDIDLDRSDYHVVDVTNTSGIEVDLICRTCSHRCASCYGARDSECRSCRKGSVLQDGHCMDDGTNTTDEEDEEEDDGEGANIAAIVGGAVGGVVGLAIIVVVIILVLRWRRQKDDLVISAAQSLEDLNDERLRTKPHAPPQDVSTTDAGQHTQAEYANIASVVPPSEGVMQHADNILRYSRDPTFRENQHLPLVSRDSGDYANKEPITLQRHLSNEQHTTKPQKSPKPAPITEEDVDEFGGQDDYQNFSLEVRNLPIAPSIPSRTQAPALSEGSDEQESYEAITPGPLPSPNPVSTPILHGQGLDARHQIPDMPQDYDTHPDWESHDQTEDYANTPLSDPGHGRPEAVNTPLSDPGHGLADEVDDYTNNPRSDPDHGLPEDGEDYMNPPSDPGHRLPDQQSDLGSGLPDPRSDLGSGLPDQQSDPGSGLPDDGEDYMNVQTVDHEPIYENYQRP